jgi:hypothetical protein
VGSRIKPDSLDEAQRVQLFTGGLLPPLSLQVHMQNLQTLAATMSLARQFELMEQYTAAPARVPACGILGALGSRPCLPAPPAATGPTPVPAHQGEGRPVKRLSKEEQEERRRLGLCYNCNEKYSRGHNCV